jgi:hypothetical protein
MFARMARSRLLRTVALAGLLAAVGCGRARQSAPLSDAGPLASVDSGQRREAEPSFAFVVDEKGIAIRGQPIRSEPGAMDEALRRIWRDASLIEVPALVRAARLARVREVNGLTRALGQAGAGKLAIHTSDPDGLNHVLGLSPLGQVPAHEDRCGVRVTLEEDDAVELRHLAHRPPERIPRGPEVPAGLERLRNEMTGCASTLWMLAGEGDAKWGAVFDLGLAISRSEVAPGTTRYIMLL